MQVRQLLALLRPNESAFYKGHMVTQTSHLPVEVWMMIVNLVEDHCDLRCLRAANRQLRALASRRLFKTLQVNNDNDMAHSVTNALEAVQSRYVSPLISRVTHEVLWANVMPCMHCSYTVYLLHDLTGLTGKDVKTRRQLSSLFSQIYRLPALAAIHCRFFGDQICSQTSKSTQADYTNPIYPEQQLILDAIFSQPLPSSVKSLTLDNLLPFMTEIYDRPAFVSAVQRLSYLDLSFLEDEEVGYWDTIVHKRFLGVCGASLTSLHLARNGELEQDSSITFDGLCFPSLHTLSLTWLFFDRTGSRESKCTLEQFITRHSATLRQLELKPYYAIIKKGPLPGPGGPFTPVWERLACAMDHLVKIDIVTHDPYRQISESPPGKLLVTNSAHTLVSNDQRQADIKALARFWRAVRLSSQL
ncbi:hypothetical protein EVG20_g1537 [Dentipellis fragilis]|uniref:F-box domain-containing protein n=1 Tax=Dentipellis fragilis TaxID=205917 RepID=A0A4Y9ZBV9_9AGAM|nr:hypothetical protein EVG20_g1537 [Dentipellis fragilis]